MKMNKNIKIVINTIIILLLLFLVLYFSLKDNYKEIVNLIKNINKGWIIIAIFCLCLYRFLNGTSMFLLIKNSKEKISLFKTFQISFIILFFHGITPFATGGQPMEVYYLHKEKISIEKSSNIVLQNFILYQTSLILVGLFTITYNHFARVFPYNSFMRKLVVLGFIINFLIWLVTFILAFGRKTGVKLIELFTNILFKLKISKNKEETKNKLLEYANRFYESAMALRKNKKLIIKALGVNILALIILYSIPWVLASGLQGGNLSLINSIVATSYVMIIGSFVPIPGGTGGIEYGFIYFFKYLISGSVLSALMLIWRFITYYMGIIIGGIILMFYRKKSSSNEKTST